MTAAARRSPCYQPLDLDAVRKPHLSPLADRHIDAPALRDAALRYETEILRHRAVLKWMVAHGARVARFMETHGIVENDGSDWDRLLAAEVSEVCAEEDRQVTRIEAAATAFARLAGEAIHDYVEGRACAACSFLPRCSRIYADACRQRYGPHR